MKRWLVIPSCLAVLLGLGIQSAEAVPTTASVTMRATDSNGEPVSGAVNVVVRIFDMDSAGTMLYEETHTTPATNGLVNIELGGAGGGPLDTSVFNGSNRWIEIVFNGTTMTPRLKVGVVPYAIKAADADTVGGMAPGSFGDIQGVTAGTGLSGGGTSGTVTVSADTNYLQRRVSTACNAGSAIRSISSTGAPTCQATGGALSCTTVSASASVTNGGHALASCAAGYQMTGGGCYHASSVNTVNFVANYPYTANTWRCRAWVSSGSVTITSYVRCCQ